MIIHNIDIATSEAANLALTKLVQILADVTAPKKRIVAAIIPIFGIRWNATVIRKVGSGELRKLLGSLRNSPIDKASYAKIRDISVGALTDEADFPQLWGPWRTSIERIDLDDQKKLGLWTPVVESFINVGWDSAQKLSLVHSSALQAAIADLPCEVSAAQFWTASVLLYTDLSSASCLLLKGVSPDTAKLISNLR